MIKIKICPICKIPFKKSSHKGYKFFEIQKYCSLNCAYKDRKSGKKSFAWKGGKIIKEGYFFIRKPNHPFAQKNGYIAEHRLIMEKHLGRFLKINEAVHHINHNKEDNRIKNLLLLSNKKHHKIHCKEYKRDNLGKFIKCF